MTTKKFIGKKPFKDVLVTGTVLDKNGQRMSKMKGNGIDPLEVFEKFGVDATRLTLAGSATGIDFRWREENVEQNRNFANKIWNATRFCLMNSQGAQVDHSSLMFDKDSSIVDRWILSRLNQTAIDVNHALETYAFHEAVSLLYHFFWNDFCDWYIELVKDEITGGNEIARTRILTILEIALRMLHPFMPFLTEELWQKLPGVSSSLHHAAYSQAGATIMLTYFPPGDKSAIDDRAENEMNAVIELISKVRNIRSEMNIKPGEKVPLVISTKGARGKIFLENQARILKLARVSSLKVGEQLVAPKASAKASLSEGAELAIPLEGLIDFEKERERLGKEIAKLNSENEKLNAQLSNESFVGRAPQDKVDEIRARVADIGQRLNLLSLNLKALSDD